MTGDGSARNSELSTRDIVKGGELVKYSIGMQNSWGLVNYVGNIQEWVYIPCRKLVTVGGSYKHRMENCDIMTINSHDGSADRSAGLRVLRELRGDS
jgi:formylglycine-generating enzyme required for sulfatase activity